MTNPFLQNYKSKFFYISVWILITGIQTLILYGLANLSIEISFVDSFIFNGLFALFCMPLWYVVKYSNPDKGIISAFILTGFILLTAWLPSSYLLLKLIFLHNDSYQQFLLNYLPWRLLIGACLYAFTMLIYYVHLYTLKLREQTQNEIRLHEILKDSELNALKSQINPHFLFNSLNSINSLVAASPAKAQEMLISLSEFLRYTALSTHQQFASLQNEIENTERYLAIEKVRFGDRLSYTFDYTPECLNLEVPAMIFQPLFENAIKHGVYESIQSIQITAHIERIESNLWIRICNNFDIENIQAKRKSGIGLQNIQSRLQLLYGNQALLQTKIEKGKFYAILRIPLIKIN